MENSSDILTIKEVAKELRCSKAHVANALLGKIKGLPRLTHALGSPEGHSPRMASAVARSKQGSIR